MKILLLILIAYLLGSIQTGLWIGKVFFHTNLREHGSGNTGTTNTFRVLGKTAGTITFLVDMLKGTLAVLLPIWLGVTEASWFCSPLLCLPTPGLCFNALFNQHDFIFKYHCCSCWTDHLGYFSSHPLLARWL